MHRVETSTRRHNQLAIQERRELEPVRITNGINSISNDI